MGSSGLRSRRRFLLHAASLASAPILLRAQENEPTFSTEVKVVDVLATVRTKKGEFVRDLAKDDFEILEDGRPQMIRYFARETDLPLTLGLMVDTSMSQGKVLDAERSASFRFLDQVLREDKDRAFLVQFDLAVIIPQELTASRSKLEEALSYVDTPSRRELSQQAGGGTLLYDAVVKAARDVMTGQKNRKAVIVLTDGVDTGSEASLDTAIEAAQRADMLVYSILFSDEGYYGLLGGGGGASVLKRLSMETGGDLFEVSKKQSIDQIYDRIQDELRSQYDLGFVSDKPVDISEFRRLQVSVKQKGLIVQARNRYWARR